MLPRMRRRAGPAILIATIGAIGLFAGGCSTVDPTISVTAARVGEETPEGVQIVFSLEGSNPNEIELPLLQAEYTVEIDGKRVFSGDRSPEATLRRLGTQGFTLPAVIALAPGQPRPTGVHPFRVTGSVGYIAPGAIAETLFDIGARRPTVSFGGTGELDFGPGPG